MSNKNYETNRNIIIELLTLMVEENDLIKIGNNIFDIGVGSCNVMMEAGSGINKFIFYNLLYIFCITCWSL